MQLHLPSVQITVHHAYADLAFVCQLWLRWMCSESSLVIGWGAAWLSWWIINWQCCKLVVKTDSDFLWLEMTNRWTSLSLLNCNNLFECSGILGCEITSLPNCLNARCKTQSYKNVEIAFSCFFVAFFSGLTLAWQFYMQAVQIYKVLYASRKIYNYYIGRELIVLSLTRPRTIIL